MDEIDALFESTKPKIIDPIRAIDEKFFQPDTEETRLRKLDRNKLLEEKAKLTKLLAQTKNVKNHRKTDLNEQKAVKRRIIKAKLAEIKLSLDDLDTEEKGEKSRLENKTSEAEFITEFTANPMV